MKKWSIWAVVGLLAACVETTPSIRWQSELQEPGSYVSIHQSGIGLIHHVFRGRDGNAHRVESYRGPAPEGIPEFTTYLDQHGNYVRWGNAEGIQAEYQPHNCVRTLGECRFTKTTANGEVSDWVRRTIATSDGYSYQLLREGDTEPTYSGHAVLDARGVAGSGAVLGPRGPQTNTLVGRGTL
ncbi:hypothetical protein [Cochlodiniinecator piscidefendens]|uniref:hypothetical protein n=1 Tax=Cochlodiniinecator piscidefendens TaxID=2715756 RepID=UPI00140B2B3F|nr:hypothetical protein [Cochlodiniinecator piscidefendens]